MISNKKGKIGAEDVTVTTITAPHNGRRTKGSLTYPVDALTFEVRDGKYYLGGMRIPFVENWNIGTVETDGPTRLKLTLGLWVTVPGQRLRRYARRDLSNEGN